MHFQPLADIAENLEEPGASRHANMALFNRLLTVGPSPTSLMEGAFRRTSAQLQRLRHFPGADPPSSDDGDEDDLGKPGKGGSLPSGLGQDTQSTVCSFRGEASARTPLLNVCFTQERRGSEGRRDDEGPVVGIDESVAPSRLPLPLQPSRGNPGRRTSAVVSPGASVALPRGPTARSTQELFRSQPVINQSRAPSAHHRTAKMSFLTVPSFGVPQRLRSLSMGSEFTSP